MLNSYKCFACFISVSKVESRTVPCVNNIPSSVTNKLNKTGVAMFVFFSSLLSKHPFVSECLLLLLFFFLFFCLCLTPYNLVGSAVPRLSYTNFKIQSTLVISNFKGLSEILRDIRTSIYQIFRVQEK